MATAVVGSLTGFKIIGDVSGVLDENDWSVSTAKFGGFRPYDKESSLGNILVFFLPS